MFENAAFSFSAHKRILAVFQEASALFTRREEKLSRGFFSCPLACNGLE
jgi:hypothetical protein